MLWGNGFGLLWWLGLLSVVGRSVGGMEGLSAPVDLASRRVAVAAAVVAVRGLASDLFAAVGSELGPLLSELDALGQACAAAQVAVVAEAVDRGEVTTSGSCGGGPRALSGVGWVLEHAPSLRAGGARAVVSLAQAFTKESNAPVAEALASGRVPVRSAAVVVDELARLRPLLVDGAEPAVVEGLLSMVVAHGPSGCRMVRPALLARHGLEGVLQREQDVARRFASLSAPLGGAVGVFEYRLSLDTEASAVLEAALGPLSGPRSVGGEPDLRSSGQRRAEALVEVVRRAVGAGHGVPLTSKAQLFVSVDYDDLVARTGAGSTLGGASTGQVLAPQTVRRVACDASVLPVVMGAKGEVLDFGRARRLFRRSQVQRLWLRDGGCSFPSCSVPAQWCDAHHLVHWADGGPSDLDNAALLCGRHHTVVHTRGLAGTLHTGDTDGTDDLDGPDNADGPNGPAADGPNGPGGPHGGGGSGGSVSWDLTPGSYDHLLAARQSRTRA